MQYGWMEDGVADSTASGYEDSLTTEENIKINQLDAKHFTKEYHYACFGIIFMMTTSKATERPLSHSYT